MKRLFLVILLVACVDQGPKPQIEGAVPYTNTSRLSALWTELEACSGLTGNLASIKFYTATSIEFRGEDRGLWVPATRRIYILDLFISSDKLVKHEMMHALLGVDGHPENYFNNVCGDIR